MLPCVVQIGFAGSRRLFDSSNLPDDRVRALEQEIEDYLASRLEVLKSVLGLPSHHFLCGVSQIAIGGDMIFGRACRRLSIPQSIFLPQPLDAYLTATSKDGTPDFRPEQRTEAMELLGSPHVIHERVVSDAADRTTRFEDCNDEILRVCDVAVCLVRADAEGKPGGTKDFISQAAARGKKVLEIQVELTNGQIQCVSRWHGPERYEPPAFPPSMQTIELESKDPAQAGSLPSVAEFCAAVKKHASQEAIRHRNLFAKAAFVIIVTHVVATACATFSLAFHFYVFLGLFLLLAELILLGLGFWRHRRLHRDEPLRVWAISRLLAEINRSVRSLGDLHIYPRYLFNLRLPYELRPVLRTINILHMRSTRAMAHPTPEQFQTIRDAYIRNRLTDPDEEKGQIAFYSARCTRETRLLKRYNLLFSICSFAAILTVSAKLILVSREILWHSGEEPSWIPFLGIPAIILPTLAVGFLSWAAANEYNARVETFGSQLEFLKGILGDLEKASSEGQLDRLVQEVEANLLGETAEWYRRRTVTEVAH